MPAGTLCVYRTTYRWNFLYGALPLININACFSLANSGTIRSRSVSSNCNKENRATFSPARTHPYNIHTYRPAAAAVAV